MMNSAISRQQQKALSRQKILDAASQRLLLGGPDNISISAVTRAAGLTHGAFYAHFSNKEALTNAAFHYAIECNQPRWFTDADRVDGFDARLARLAKSYLSREHRDNPAQGCAIAALASVVENAQPSLKAIYAEAVEQTVQRIAQRNPHHVDRAIELLATITGAINMARNTANQKLSDQILRVTAGRFATPDSL